MPRPAARKSKTTETTTPLPPGWKEVAGYTRPHPAVNPENREYGKRVVGVALAIDTEGLMWERIDGGDWACLGRPPAPPERDPDR